MMRHTEANETEATTKTKKQIEIGDELETTDGRHWVVLDVDAETNERPDDPNAPAMWVVSADNPDVDAFVSLATVRRVW